MFIEPASVRPSLPGGGRTITPEGIDRAALENCAGGGFFPGIEVGWQIRHPSIYAEPFRIDPGRPSPYLGDEGNMVKAGHFSRQMAVPWQADFLQCKSEDDNTKHFPNSGMWGWWPAQRPDSVFVSEDDLDTPSKSLPWHRPTKPDGWPEGFDGDNNTPSYNEMLSNWTKFGFIVEKKEGVIIEDEREANIP